MEKALRYKKVKKITCSFNKIRRQNPRSNAILSL